MQFKEVIEIYSLCVHCSFFAVFFRNIRGFLAALMTRPSVSGTGNHAAVSGKCYCLLTAVCHWHCVYFVISYKKSFYCIMHTCVAYRQFCVLYLIYMCIVNCFYMYFTHINVSGRSFLLFNKIDVPVLWWMCVSLRQRFAGLCTSSSDLCSWLIPLLECLSVTELILPNGTQFVFSVLTFDFIDNCVLMTLLLTPA